MSNNKKNEGAGFSVFLADSLHKGKGGEQFIAQAMQIRDTIGSLNTLSGNTEFISLGYNCSTAHYLREVGLRKAAYPFDWVFSSAEIIVDACNDSFESFMDKSQWVKHERVKNITHQRYHEYFFAHKDPLANKEDYGYCHRACQRFSELLATHNPLCFVITLITEPDKRLGWTMGFTQSIKQPESQTIESVSHLINFLKNAHPNSVFVVIEHYTQVPVDASIENITSDLIHLRFCAQGISTGKKYVNEVDDLCFKIILSGLALGKYEIDSKIGNPV